MSALGTEFTLNIHLEPIDGYHMEDYDFDCEFYVFAGRSVIKKKKDMIKVDKDNYTAIIEGTDAIKIGRGQMNALVTAYVPDANFANGVRIEKRVFVCNGAKAD